METSGIDHYHSYQLLQMILHLSSLLLEVVHMCITSLSSLLLEVYKITFSCTSGLTVIRYVMSIDHY